jgi:hypothetical protein
LRVDLHGGHAVVGGAVLVLTPVEGLLVGEIRVMKLIDADGGAVELSAEGKPDTRVSRADFGKLTPQARAPSRWLRISSPTHF